MYCNFIRRPISEFDFKCAVLVADRSVSDFASVARDCSLKSRSSSGLGHRPFTAATRVRLPYGTPLLFQSPKILSLANVQTGSCQGGTHQASPTHVRSHVCFLAPAR